MSINMTKYSKYFVTAMIARANFKQYSYLSQIKRTVPVFERLFSISTSASTFSSSPTANAIQAKHVHKKYDKRIDNLQMCSETERPFHGIVQAGCWKSFLGNSNSATATSARSAEGPQFSQHFQKKQMSRLHHSKCRSVSTALTELKERFDGADIPEAEIAAEFIVAHALGIGQISEFARVDPARLLSVEEMRNLTTLADKKISRMPLQYIIGEWDFRDLTLKMKPPVFIPRPETEMLIDLLISHYGEEDAINVLEVGCGSGAISLSILSEFPKVQVTAIDASVEAVKLTQENAERLDLSHRLNVQHVLLTEGSIPDIQREASSYDFIISNPPYVFSNDMDDLELEISRYEDHRALEAGPEGMSVITAIIRQARHLLRPGGLVWLETDVRHHQLIQEWLHQHPETRVKFRRSFLDFTDRPRFCQLEYIP